MKPTDGLAAFEAFVIVMGMSETSARKDNLAHC
jgi:hypothetical protein